MNIASVVVVSVLFMCFWFFISLPFGVERESTGTSNFGGIRHPNLWKKVLFALSMSALSTVAFFTLQSMGYFDGLLKSR